MKYNLSEIYSILEKDKSIFTKEIIDNLLEIKKNNKFIKRKSPIKINTEISTSWRIKHQQNNKDFEDILTSYLNKICEKNYNDIKQKLLELIKEDNINTIIEAIFTKIINEKNSDLFVKLIIDINIQTSITNIIINLIENFYKTLDNIKFSEDTYDELCESNKIKNNFYFFFSFISKLYYFNENLIKNSEIIKNYYNNLLVLINTDSNLTEFYINCLVNLVEKSFNKISLHNNEIKKNFEEMSQNRSKFSNKSRFLIIDLLENNQ